MDMAYLKIAREVKIGFIDILMLQYFEKFDKRSLYYKQHIAGKMAMTRIHADTMDEDMMKKNLGYGLR